MCKLITPAILSRSSNDDGAKLLWLQFRGRQEEDEFVLQQTNPKVITCT